MTHSGMSLELDRVRLSYTGAAVIADLSLAVRPGEILCSPDRPGAASRRCCAHGGAAGARRRPGARRRRGGDRHVARPRDGVPGRRAAALAQRAFQRRTGAALRGEPRADAGRAGRPVDRRVGLAGFGD